MRLTILLLMVAIILTTHGCTQNKGDKLKIATEMTVDDPFPFRISEKEGQFTITAFLESDELYTKYYTFFQEQGYEGNGYCWDGHITQILEKTDKELLTHIQFDPEAGTFFAYADSRDNQFRFINTLSPIFADLALLEEYVKTADRDRIND